MLHYHIEFKSEVPYQAQEPRHIYSSLSDKEEIDGEISKLLLKGVIERTCLTGNGFVSNVFVRPKKDGTYRMILNLKSLNEFVVYQHFKMNNILTALKLMRPKCFMASVDLKDAYYSVPKASEDRKFLSFEWKGDYYQYTCLPNGLACAPRLFTKILKPIYAHLHSVGHVSMGHIDDSFLVGYTRSACELNIQHTVECFDSLGFVIHPEKSVLIPTQELEFLGFLLNSISMTIRLPPSKAAHVKSACLLVSSLPGVQFGRLHYRQLEKDKSRALQLCKGNYDGPVTLSNDSRSELEWWVNNITSSFMPITQGKPDFILTADASKIGWGAVCGDNKTGGCWDLDEQQYHINYLESKAVLLGLKSLCSGTQNKHIRIQSDNTTTVAYLNAMGGIKSLNCNDMAIQIWEWCSQRNIWISASHIPGSINVEADKESRKINDSTEWSLSMIVYNRLAQLWGPFQLDNPLPSEDRGGPIFRSASCPPVAHTTLVSSASTVIGGPPSPSTATQRSTDSTSQHNSSSIGKDPKTVSMSSLRQSILQRNISEAATSIIMQSWAANTHKQYQPYVAQRLEFCRGRETNPYDPPIGTVLDFLVTLHDKGLKYSTLNTARSAISAVILPTNNHTIGTHPLVSRFMRGIYKSNPPTPRYHTTWNVQTVLTYLSAQDSVEKLDLKSLTLKLLMLIALVSAQRGQSIHILDTACMKVTESSYEFSLPEHVKQSRPSFKTPSVILKAYPVNTALCVYSHLTEYLRRTQSLRGAETKLFTSFVKPHKRVSRDTISRWIRTTMESAGIDISMFKPHSTRMAATSRAKGASVPIQEILRTAGWSSSGTFDRFYDKPLMEESTFASAVLNND
ncbi:uncharacterized protein [Montipora foliosa]|uniref:uncharacterized protein n=1 Tax=Montipora foliosa TaxID=591990 RepID=UPI0035F13D5F